MTEQVFTPPPGPADDRTARPIDRLIAVTVGSAAVMIGLQSAVADAHRSVGELQVRIERLQKQVGALQQRQADDEVPP